MSADIEDVTPIEKREASSKKSLSWANPVILRDSAKNQIEFIPFFIKRTEGTQLAFKLQTYKKPDEWTLEKDKAISLNESEARKLLKALGTHLAVSEKEDGAYIVLKSKGELASLDEHDPVEIAGAVISLLEKEEIVEHLDFQDLSDELITAFRSAIRLKELKSAVAVLRRNLEEEIDDEKVYQDWCDKHSWAFGNAYVMRDEVRNISAGDRVDLLLPMVITGFRDIVELKRPSADVLFKDKVHRNYYFSSDVSKAIGQCHRYLDVLHEVASKGLMDHPEIVAYHPRAIIVIGRSMDWDKDKLRALHGLNQRLNRITVMTYDQLVAQGQRIISILSDQKSQEDEFEDEDLFEDDIEDEEDSPF